MQQMEKIKKEMKEDKDAAQKIRDNLEKKILLLNNKLADANAELKKGVSSQRSRPSQPHHPNASGSSVVADAINNAVGWY